MDARAKRAVAKIQALHDELYNLWKDFEGEVTKSTSLQEIADLSYACREVSNLAEQIGKDARKLKKAVDMVACLQWLQDTNASPNIQTVYCTATPDIKEGIRMPSNRNSPEYKRILEGLGLDPDLSPFIKISYKEMQKLADKNVDEGRPMPEGLLPSKYQTYELNIRARSGKGILE